MKRLVRASRWIKEVFPEGGVGVATVEGWVRDAVIPGVIIDGIVFVDADRAALLLENNIELKPTPANDLPAAIATGNANIARIVQAGLEIQPRAARS